ncbi:MAG: hypothetical protein RXS42_08705 [Nitrososphaeria archaeon]
MPGSLISGCLDARSLTIFNAWRAASSVTHGFLSTSISSPSSAVNSGKRSL